MAELFQRRHFNWLADLLGEIEISDNDLENYDELETRALKWLKNNMK